MEKFLQKVKHLKLITVLCLVVMLSSFNKVVAQIAGSTCSNPIAITSLPFNHSGNTQDYGNDYDRYDVPAVAPGAVVTGTGSTNYLDGNEVVFELMAPTDGTININTTNTSAWVGLWVFTDCPFSSTVGYHTATSGTSRGINGLSVSAGTTYYIVISVWDIGVYIDYTLDITGNIVFSDCEGTPNPGNTIASVENACSMQDFVLSLENVTADAGVTYQWESADDIDFTVNVETLGVSSTQVANISSEKYFRCLVTCTNSSESAYSTPVFVAIEASFMNCYCTPPNSNCSGDYVASVVLNSLNDMNQTCTPIYEDRSAAQNAIPYLIQGYSYEMSVGVGSGGNEYVGVWIDFDQNGIFEADEFFALGNGNDEVITNTITIPIDALAGNTKMRVRAKYGSAFDGTDACGGVNYGSTRDYLVNIAVPPTCLEPTNLQVSDVSATSATLSWDESLSLPVNGYQVFYNITGEFPEESSASMGNIPAGNTTHQTGDILSPNTTYYVWLRADCGEGDLSFWAGPLSFTTTQIPAILPYEDDFATNQFTFINGTQTNQWAYGSAEGNPENAIYISNDGGTSNAYTVYSSGGATSVVQAYRDIAVPVNTSIVNLSFDWQCVGEGTTYKYDYFRVWLVPTDYLPEAGNQILAGDGRIKVGNEFNQQSTWQTYNNNNLDISSFAGQTMRLVFEWRNDGSGGTQPPAAIDNVSIIVPNCVKPTNVEISNIGSTSATVSWTASTSEPASYQVFYSTSDATPAEDETQVVSIDTTSIDLIGLDVNALYYVWVRSDCGVDGYSDWSQPNMFITTQIPATLPYADDFETNNFTFVNGTQTNQWAYGSAEGNPENAIYISNDGGTSNAYTVYSSGGATSVVQAYRDIEIPSGTSLVNVSFDWKGYGESSFDYLRVWMVPVTYVPVAGTQITSEEGGIQIGGNFNQQDTWQNYQNPVVDMTSFAGQTMRLVFEWQNDGSGGTQPPAAIDNLNIFAPDCVGPTNVEISLTSVNSAEITWNESTSNPDGYQIYYSTTAVAPTDTTEALVSLPAGTTSIATGEILEINTQYYLWIRSVCGSDSYSDWVGPVTVTTPMVVTPPWSEGFASSATPAGWTTSSMSLNNSNSAIINGGASGYFMYKNLWSSATTGNFSTVLVGPISGTEDFSFDYKIANYSSPYAPPASGTGNFVLEISTDFGNTWSEIETVSNNGVAGWQNKSYPISTYAIAGDYVKFRITANWISGDYCIGFDNFNLASCFPISGLSVANIEENSATISWNASTSSPANYNVYYSEVNAAPANDIADTEYAEVSGLTTTLSSLSANTKYYVWVRSDCGASDFSAWGGPVEFTTSCAPESTLPYTQNFDSYSSGEYPDCWLRPVTYNGFPSIVSGSSYSVSSPNGLKFQSLTTTPTYAISPAFSEDIHNLRVKFQLRAESTTSSGTIELGVMSDPYDLSTFESVAIIQPENTSFNAYQYDLYSTTLSGENRHIAFKHNSNADNYYFWLDNFEVELSPDCVEPNGFAVNSVTANSANISWTVSVSNPGSYHVYYSTSNIEPADDITSGYETTNTNSIELSNLESNTTYYVWVRSNCDGTDFSVWAGPVEFTTLCAPESTLPYTQNFDSYSSGEYPDCWLRPVTYNGFPSIVSGSSYSVSSPNGLKFQSLTTTPTYAISPAFSEDIHNLRVSFNLKAEGIGASQSGTMELGVMSDPYDLSTFESVAIIQPENTSFNAYQYDLYSTTLSGANNYIALRHNSNSSSWYYWLDDFKVELSPSCFEPANFEASNINTTSVSLSWTALPTAPENGYDIYVSETETAPTELSAPTHNTAEALINIEGLTSATVYYAWLRANCSSSDVSAWTGPVVFSTLCEPDNIPYYQNFESVTEGEIPVCTKVVQAGTGNLWTTVSAPGYGFTNMCLQYKYHSSNAANCWYFTNGLNLQEGVSYRLTYKYGTSSTSSVEKLKVTYGTSASPSDVIATIVDNPNISNDVAAIQVIDFTPTTSGIYYIGFNVYSAANQYWLYIDDISIELSPSCIEPTDLVIGNVTENSASISWTESLTLPENGYDIYFSTTATAPTGSSTPTHNTNETSFLFENLDESTSYYVWVRANCNSADQSDWTGPLHIYTGYCIPTNTSASYWISSLTTTGGITNISHTGITSQPGGYGDFSAIHSCSNVEGQPTMINFAQNTGTGYYFCWIDWNKDMQFDATERIIAATSSYSSTYQGTINIPAGTEPGEYRMRVANSYLYEITDACTGSGYGQYFDYTFVVVEPANNETDILTYSFEEQIAPATIDNVEHKVYVTVAAGTNLNGLVATFTLSEGATATVAGLPQQSGVTPNNFTYPVVYKVVAENGLDEEFWQVIVDVEDTGLSSEADILAYTIPNQVGLTSINSTNRTVALTVPYGTDLTALVATFTLSNGATAEVETVAQQSGVTPNNFTNPVTYTVTAENGTTTKDWTVTVTEAPASDQADILAYVIPNQVGLTSINSTNRTVALTVPYGTDVTALVATFTLSNGATAEVETVAQQSGVTPNNFTNPVTYTVTAQNGTTTKDWIVTVTVAGEPLSSEADILTFSFAEQFEEAIINNVNRTVNIKVNEGTSLDALVATFTLSPGASAKIGAVDQESGVTENNFTDPVIYTVTAEDGTTTKDWTVTVSVYVGIEDVENSALAIYPNPNNGRFTLDFTNINGKVNYQIYDTKGSIIISDDFVANGSAIKEVSLNLVPGVYYVKLITETQSLIEKLVVE